MNTQRVGSLVSNEDFRQAMLPLTDALQQWAVAWVQQYSDHGMVPNADSKAMAEYDSEQRWSVPDWREPIRNAFSYGDIVAYALAEHLAALATVVHSPVGPAYSHMSIVRAVLEAAPIAHWLLDPAIGPAKRIKRSIVFRLESANQSGRMKHIAGAATDAQKARAACQAYVRAQGWTLKGSPQGMTLDGEVLPTARQYSRMAFGHSSPDLDQTIWNLTSATQHSVWYALQTALGSEDLSGHSLDPNGRIAPIVVRGEALTMHATLCFEGCDAVARAREKLYGWTRPPEMFDAAGVVRAHGQALAKTRQAS